MVTSNGSATPRAPAAASTLLTADLEKQVVAARRQHQLTVERAADVEGLRHAQVANAAHQRPSPSVLPFIGNERMQASPRKKPAGGEAKAALVDAVLK